MNLNPLTFLLVLAPAAVIGALLFIFVYDGATTTADLERDRMRLESLEFQRDAAAAWNGGRLEAPDADEIARLRERIAGREAAADAAAAERCARMAELADNLSDTLKQGKGPATEC